MAISRKGIPRTAKVPMADRLAAMSIPEPNTGCVLFDGPVLPPAAIEARDAEIARLRAVLERIIAMPSFGVWHMDLAVAVARAALAPPPASDGGEA